MREIKFRFWHKDQERFLYAESLQAIDHISFLAGRIPLNWLVDQQYIGIKDKYGVEIYEGDLVKFDGPTKLCEGLFMHSIYEIDFYEGSYNRPYIYHSFDGENYSKLPKCKIVNPTGRAMMDGNAKFDWKDAEIVGNIFETKLIIEK